MSDFDTLNAQGLAERGDLLGDAWEQPAPAEPVVPPRLDGAPEFPTPGIYFGMPEATYHAIHAASTSGLKRLSVSSMDYWADSVLNPNRDEDRVQKDYFDFGHAIHTLVLEGEEAYAARYVVGIDKPDGVLETTDEIKAKIVALGHKPITQGFDDVTRKAKKEDWIAQLQVLDPSVKIWSVIMAEFERLHEGAEIISAKIDRRVRIGAKMILAQPEIAKAFTGGYPEVSVFWYCPVTGCPMKARFDYLKMRVIPDLKSFANPQGMPIDRAIERAIATRRYNMQHVIYEEAAMQARAMIRERGLEAIKTFDPEPDFNIPVWCESWAKQTEPPGFLLVFQQSGNAPVTRGKIMPRGTVYSVTKSRITDLKRRWIECAQAFGTDPWLDIAPIDEIDDEAIPLYATEI